jgi:hypothetical protein
MCANRPSSQSLFGMHLFDTDDPQVIASQRSFFITISVFSATTYVMALSYPMWQLVRFSRDRLNRQWKSDGGWRDMLQRRMARKGGYKEEDDGAADGAADGYRDEELVLKVRRRRLRLMETID